MRLLKLIPCLISISVVIILNFSSCSEDSPTTPQPGHLSKKHLDQVKIHLINEIYQQGNPGEAIKNPISVQTVNEFQQPVSDVPVIFKISGNSGTLIKNGEKTTGIKEVSDSTGIAEVIWILGYEENNLLDISVNDNDYIAVPLLVGAVVKQANEVLLFSFRWLETNEFQFPHVLPPYYIEYDNRVLESNHFLTFSDASADAIRIEFSMLAEKSLVEIMEDFKIPNATELGITGTDSKVKIYTRKSLDENPHQYTFSYGFLLYGIDSYPRKYLWPQRARDRFNQEVKHEVVHMVQYLMGVHYHMCPDWFMEGIAEHMSGGAFYPIINVQQFEAWLDHPDHYINPIDIHSTDDYPPPYERVCGEYYPMFHLILSYLLSENGLGKSYLNVKSMFEEIAVTDHFNQAFYSHFGISTEELKENLYQRLRQFLTRLSIIHLVH